MSKLGLVIVMLLIAGKSNAQNYQASNNEPLSYFVLIQADDNQAFYVRLNGQLYPSSPAGYIILARLHDSLYAISIGLPGQTFPEKRYLLDIHRKDLALRLRYADSKWELYDRQGQALPTVADPSATGRPSLAGVKKDDAFSQLMSAVVQDTAVMYNNYAAASDSAHPGAPTTSRTVIPSPHSDATFLIDSQTAAASSLTMPTSPPFIAPATGGTSHPAASLISPGTGHPDTSLTSSAHDSSNIAHDTLTTFLAVSTSSATIHSPTGRSSAHALPIDGPKRPSPADTPVSLSNAGPSSPTGVVKLSERKSSKSLRMVYTDRAADKKSDTIDVLIPIDSPAIRTEHPTHSTDPTLGAATPNNSATPASPGAARKALIPFVNSDCHAFATDYDVDKLRIRMLDVEKDDDRLLAARKVFKTKCFTTHQIRALSEVFATDAAKFKFLETAYPFCSDENFPDLISLLADPVYAGRFRTMTDRH
jgi:Domain of unknown function (DUF4476)